MKATHKQKLKISKRIGGFNSQAWQNRKDAIVKRVETKIKKIKLAIKKKQL